MALDPEHTEYMLWVTSLNTIVPLLFANSVVQKQGVERKRVLKQAQGPANLHHKSWKQKDHLPNQKASKTAGGGDNFFEEVKGKKNKPRFQKEKYSKQY